MITPEPQFRLKLDVPYTFDQQPGYTYAKLAHDFATDTKGFNGTWQDPLTGIVMLKPSFLNEAYGGGFQGLANWNFAAGALDEVRRSADGVNTAASLFTFSQPSPSEAAPVELVTSLVIAGLVSELAAADYIEIALESKFTLVADEGFAIHYYGISDQMHRKRNWFSVIWDNIQVHFSMDGTVRVYQYATRGDYSTTPTLLQTFEIASPGDLLGLDGYFIFLPIPGRGLRLLHSRSPQSLPSLSSSARSNASRGALIPLPTRTTATGGFATILDASKVWIAVNPYHPMVLGFQPLRYKTGTSTYLDGIIDPPYKPTLAPDDVSAFYPGAEAGIGRGTLSATLRKPDDSGAWTAGATIITGDRQGRVKVSMGTTDTKYTPFCNGYGVKWLPVRTSRDTTALMPDRLFRLEYTEDDMARIEGTATTLMSSAANRALVERGDTTWLIEKSLDDGATWATVGGGLAQVSGDVDAHIDSAGLYYLCQWKLQGMESRFDEISQTLDTAFDGLKVGDAINVVLASSGFPFLATLPAELQAIQIPSTPQGQNWRWGSREGDKGDDITKQLLLLAKTQFVEWRLRWDWDAVTWVAEKRPRDTSAGALWILTDDSAAQDIAGRIACYSSMDGSKAFTFKVSPPECNIVQAFGLTSPDPAGQRVPGTPIYNIPSLKTKTDVDYLGRAKTARPLFAPIDKVADINRMGRRVFDASAHRRLQPLCIGRDYIDGFTPGKQVTLHAVGADLFTGLWLRRRSVVIDYNQSGGTTTPSVTYALDSIWDGAL